MPKSPHPLPFLVLAAAALSCVPNPSFEGDEGSPGTPICGDGIIDLGEDCDDGPANADDAACTQSCEMAYCGDGLVHADVESCDDADGDNYDGCTSHCEFVFSDNFADGFDLRWQLLGTQSWLWMQTDSGAFVEATLTEPQTTALHLEFELSSPGVMWFDERILDEGADESIALTLTVDDELLMSDGSSSIVQRHEFPLSAGPHTFRWSATATSGDGSVRLDNVYIGPQTP